MLRLIYIFIFIYLQSGIWPGSRCPLKNLKTVPRHLEYQSKLSAKSHVWFRRRCGLKNLKMAALETILNI